MSAPIVELRNVTKRFDRVVAVKDFTMEMQRGTFLTLLGPSGCGKTTVLRMIAGFYDPDSGEVYLGGRLVNGVPPFKRNTALVFQDYALFPHMNVFENIAYGLKIRKVPVDEVKKKVREALELMNLQGYESRSPLQLSGGEQQRVALARALVVEPEVLLLDEPLSNLDAKLRVSMRREIRDLQRKLKISTVYVTHDQEEALSISDRVIVMNKGSKMQEGTPEEVYFKPQNRFVAEFIGTRNFVEGEVVSITEEDMLVDVGVGVPLSLFPDPSFNVGDKGTLVCRAEAIRILRTPPAFGTNVIRGRIVTASFLGSSIHYVVKTDKIEWHVITDAEQAYEGDVYIFLDKSKCHLMRS